MQILRFILNCKMLPFDDTVVAFAAGPAADNTALVATAGLFVRPEAVVELSNGG